MHTKKKLCLAMTTATLLVNSLSGVSVFAQEIPSQTTSTEQTTNISPRYKYIISADLGLIVDSSGATYDLNVHGIADVTKISGTLTLYKKSSNGSYVSVSSKKISENTDTIDLYGTLTASGRGDYKLTFSGTVSTKNGSETITISETDSY